MMGFIKFLAFISIVYGVVGLILRGVKKGADREADSQKGNAYYKPKRVPVFKAPVYFMLAGFFTFILGSMVVRVAPQEVGILITPSGVSSDELLTGWHVVAPWNEIKFMDKTEWVYTFTHKATEGSVHGSDAIWAPTKDGIKVGFDVSVSWRVDPKNASWIFENISAQDGTDEGRYRWIEENIIRTKTKSGLALMVSNYSPIEVYSNKREELQARTAAKLAEEFRKVNLILMHVDLREVFYNPEYEKAINDKKLAEQEALRLVEVTKQKEEQLKQAEIEKNISIEQAKGESEALQIKGQSISNNPKVIQLEWINKWDGKLPSIMTGNGSSLLMNIDPNK